MHSSIVNNLISILKAGAFGSPVNLEPMSRHKWRKMIQAADRLGVLGYIAMGAEKVRQNEVGQEFQETQGIVAFQREFPLSEASLFNHWSDKRLMEVREEEMNAPDTSEATLLLLDTIVANAHSIITTDINIEGILSLGRMLRQHSKDIDTSKLLSWLSYIGLVQVANLEANILVLCWDFTPDEIPFYRKPYPKVKALHYETLRHALTSNSFSTLTRLNIALTETFSYNFMNSISKITDIEE